MPEVSLILGAIQSGWIEKRLRVFRLIAFSMANRRPLHRKMLSQGFGSCDTKASKGLFRFPNPEQQQKSQNQERRDRRHAGALAVEGRGDQPDQQRAGE